MKLSRIKGVKIPPLTRETLLKAIVLGIRHYLTYFVSQRAVTVLLYDASIISTDRVYSAVKGLTVLNPREL